MSELKALRVPLPVIILLSALILACGSTEETSDYTYYEDTSGCSSGSSSSGTGTYTPSYTPSDTTPTAPTGPTFPDYIAELDPSIVPAYPRTADVTLQYTEPSPPASSTFYQDMCAEYIVSSHRGAANDPMYNDYFSIFDTTALLVAESETRYNSDGSSTKYAHGLAFLTFDTSKRVPFGDVQISTADRYLLGMGYMRDGYFHGPWWFNHIDEARQGLESKTNFICGYQYGKAAGECRWWDKEGYLTERGWFSAGQRHGTFTYWDDFETTQREYINGTAYGTYLNWGIDGCLEYRTQIYGTQFYGKWESWDPDSTTRYQVGYCKLGQDRGWRTTYDDQGRLTVQAWYEDGVDNGPFISYAPEGHKLWEGRRSGGVHHGLFKRFTADGFNDFDSEHVNGLQTGPVHWYYKGGKTWGTGQFTEAKREGRFTWYREDGTVTSVEDYKADKLNGEKIEYDTLGNITRHDIYADGVFVRSELVAPWPSPDVAHDEFGNPLARTYGRWQVATQEDGPAMATGMAMAWHGELGGCVMFGGRLGSGVFSRVSGDTWLRKDGKWGRVFKAETAPPARENAAIAYDSARGVIVLFGGNDKEGKLLSDTWELSKDGWQQCSVPTVPRARSSARMAYDTARGVCVMYGGSCETDAWGFTEILNSTEEWDGTAWRAVTVSAPPPALHSQAMAYDEELGVVVMQGGETFKAASSATWVYDGRRWAVAEMYDEGGDSHHAMVYDTKGRQMRLVRNTFDEGQRHVLEAFSPEFIWGTPMWTCDEHQVAAARAGFVAAFDRDTLELVVFGGESLVNRLGASAHETLVLTDETQADRDAIAADFVAQNLQAPGWSWIDNGAFAGQALDFTTIAQDRGRGVTVMFGGYEDGGYAGGTREFANGRWTLMQPKDSPSARSGAMAWYDETRKTVMLMGGYGAPIVDGNVTRFNDLWEWNGKNWKRLRESVPGMPSETYSWTYDAARGVLVAFAPNGEKRALYEFNGTAWKLTEAGEPAENIGGGYLAFDPGAGKALYFGAYQTGSYAHDSRAWYWDGKYWEEAAFEGTLSPGSINYRIHADHVGKAIWQVTPDVIRRYKDGQWTQWRCPAALAVWSGGFWVDAASGHVFFHGAKMDFSEARNDTLEFDPEKGEQK